MVSIIKWSCLDAQNGGFTPLCQCAGGNNSEIDRCCLEAPYSNHPERFKLAVTFVSVMLDVSKTLYKDYTGSVLSLICGCVFTFQRG